VNLTQDFNQNKIPTTVFTGFLGSGKTTIIKNLVDHLIKKGQKVAYIKNEIGAEDFDTQLMQGENIQTKELLNGCICCTLVGPFMAAIDELAMVKAFDRIIIETAGSADPASMALSVSNHPKLVRDGVITVVDVVNFDGYEDLSYVAKRQAEFTDLIVFNKVELVDSKRKEAVVGYVREFNEHAPIVEAVGGVLNPDLAFGMASVEVQEMIESHTNSDSNSNSDSHTNSDLHSNFSQPQNTQVIDGHHSDYRHQVSAEISTHQHQAKDGISAFTFVSQATFDKNALKNCVQTQLPKTVIRIKGLVHFESGWEVVNSVYKRFDSRLAPQELLQKSDLNQQTRLIIIGYRINDDAKRVTHLLRHAELHDAVDSSKQQLE
jgi:G3E family GTPase